MCHTPNLQLKPQTLRKFHAKFLWEGYFGSNPLMSSNRSSKFFQVLIEAHKETVKRVTDRTSLCSVLRQGLPQTATAVSLQGGLGAHMEETVGGVTPQRNFSSPSDYMKAELVIFPSPRVYIETDFEIFPTPSDYMITLIFFTYFFMFFTYSFIFPSYFYMFFTYSFIFLLYLYMFFTYSFIFPTYSFIFLSYFSHKLFLHISLIFSSYSFTFLTYS